MLPVMAALSACAANQACVAPSPPPTPRERLERAVPPVGRHVEATRVVELEFYQARQAALLFATRPSTSAETIVLLRALMLRVREKVAAAQLQPTKQRLATARQGVHALYAFIQSSEDARQ